MPDQNHFVNKFIVAGESEAEFFELKQGWFADYNPGTPTSITAVSSCAVEQWFVIRSRRNLNEVQFALGQKSCLEWTDEDHKNLERFLKYKSAAERSFGRSFNQLESLRKSRVRESEMRERSEHRAASFEMKWQLQREKLEREQLKDNSKEQLKAETSANKQADAEVKAANKQEPVVKTKASATVKKKEESDPPLTRAQELFRGQRHVKKRGVVTNLTQWIEVEVVNDKTVTRIYPKTAEELIKTGQGMWPAPTLVYRRFNFIGAIPPEYHWVTSDPGRRERGGAGIQRMTADAWLEQIEIETKLGVEHLGPVAPGNLPRPLQRGGCECPVCTANQDLLDRWEKGDLLLPTQPGQTPCPESEGLDETLDQSALDKDLDAPTDESVDPEPDVELLEDLQHDAEPDAA